ncbi:MAG: nucleoside hydrolase [Chloroflexi bacterium]|nr:nucleoside hydrolase [Chloroflexota bacterium]
MKRILIDTDPGTDDAIALLMALNAPEIEVAGITTTGGNASLAHVTRNVLSILEHMGRADVPVARGAAGPLLGGTFHHAYDLHGHRGIGVHFPRATTTPVAEDAPAFMARLLSGSASPMTVVALGPLTNMALLLRRHPQAALRIGGLVATGGALRDDNGTPTVEFNVGNDPEAASSVLSSGLPVVLVPREACDQVRLEARDLARFRDARTPAARLAYRILLKWFQRQGFDRSYVPSDPLAMAIALQPAVASYARGAVTVDITSGETRGQTLLQPGDGPIAVAGKIDARAFHTLLDALLLKS